MSAVFAVAEDSSTSGTASSSASSASSTALVEFFVDGANGNDANNGTTLESPWKTLTRAQQAIQDLNNDNGNNEGKLADVIEDQ